MNKTIKNHRFIILQAALALLIFLTFITLSGTAVRQFEEQQKSVLRERVSERTQIIEYSILNEINSSLNLVLGLVGFINVNPVPSQTDFETLARVIIQKSEIIRNIGLAPENIISYIYPLEGNEAAIGFDYMKNPEQRESVIKAIETGKEVLSGPVALIQGGEGLIARIPVYTGENLDIYWGIASIVVDTEKLFNKINIQSSDYWLNVAIKGKDGKGLEGEIIIGDEEVFEKNPVLKSIALPSGLWVIAAEPKNGWILERNFWANAIWWFGLFLALILTLLILNILSSNRKMRFLALHDPLTKLANRRLFQILSERQIILAERSRVKFYMIYIDLDNFKMINDLHGHRMGDRVLQEITNAIMHSIRKTDIFARIGGDEFILLPCRMRDLKDLNKLCEKIINIVNELTERLSLKARLGCSIGISCYPDDSKTIDEMIKNADDAMYLSKENGKNQFSYYSTLISE